MLVRFGAPCLWLSMAGAAVAQVSLNQGMQPAPKLDIGTRVHAESDSDAAQPRRTAGFDTSVIRESSALQASRRQPGVFWTLSDSGNPATLYALSSTGEILQSFDVGGVSNVDWEALALDDDGNLYLGDVGNNANRRRDLAVHVVREPLLSRSPPRGSVPEPLVVERSIAFRYREQEQPPNGRVRNFDAEALFWARDALYLLTKERTDRGTVLYRFREDPVGGPAVLERLGRFELGEDAHGVAGTVTGADASADGSVLAVLGYRAIYLFARPEEGDDYLSAPPLRRIALDPRRTKQAEGIAWDGDDLLFTNEQGDIFRVDAALPKQP